MLTHDGQARGAATNPYIVPQSIRRILVDDFLLEQNQSSSDDIFNGMGSRQLHRQKCLVVVKEYSQSTHHMETRSRTCARKLKGFEAGQRVERNVNNDRGYHDQHGGSIDLTQRGQTTSSITQKAGISHRHEQIPRVAARRYHG